MRFRLKRRNSCLLHCIEKQRDLFLGEAYSNGSAVIENGTLTEFLDIALKNVGRNETHALSEFLN